VIGSGVYPVVLPWLALLFPIPNPPGGQSSPNLSAGSSIARQVLGLDSRNNGGWLLGYIWGQRRKWGVLVVVFQCCSLFCDLSPSAGGSREAPTSAEFSGFCQDHSLPEAPAYQDAIRGG